MLRHLNTGHGLTVEPYRERWNFSPLPIQSPRPATRNVDLRWPSSLALVAVVEHPAPNIGASCISKASTATAISAARKAAVRGDHRIVDKSDVQHPVPRADIDPKRPFARIGESGATTMPMSIRTGRLKHLVVS
jgi:hypothetical protein